MRISWRRKAVAALVAANALAVAPAAAAPVSVQQDGTDNRLRFTYDRDPGTFARQSSSRRSDEGAVRFEVAVSESEGYGAGLVGRLRLRLEGERAHLYEGWFALTVTDDQGDVAYTRTVPATIHLKPRPGERKASLTFRFDLPSGRYEAAGEFETGHLANG